VELGAADPALVAYDPFAEAYDAFTADHDYESWIASIEGLVRDRGLPGRRLLDVACGTGKSLGPWLARGYQVAGCDLSPRMLDVARRKFPEARLFEADMRRLAAVGTFDLVTCLDDAVNYVLNPADLALAFRCAADRLRVGGIYVFDMNSLRAYREDFAAERIFVSGDWRFRWRGEGGGDVQPGGISAATITAHARGPSRPRAIRSRHTQRHHPLPVVRELLAAVGMDAVAVLGQQRDGSLHVEFDELTHAKALVLARRSGYRR
jgi:SAM-dependent methyltransferase